MITDHALESVVLNQFPCPLCSAPVSCYLQDLKLSIFYRAPKYLFLGFQILLWSQKSFELSIAILSAVRNPSPFVSSSTKESRVNCFWKGSKWRFHWLLLKTLSLVLSFLKGLNSPSLEVYGFFPFTATGVCVDICRTCQWFPISCSCSINNSKSVEITFLIKLFYH